MFPLLCSQFCEKGGNIMTKDNLKYGAYIDILKEELVPAMGCTEPIAIAYASAKARETLGVFPTACDIAVSGNIIKNAKSVFCHSFAKNAFCEPSAIMCHPLIKTLF